ncbi:MAG: lysophospholipid acyltransferase family protein [Acidimicrobiia bacterium]
MDAIPSPQATPDIEPLACRFDPESRRDVARTRASEIAVRGSLRAAALTAPLAARHARASIARRWSQLLISAARIDLRLSGRENIDPSRTYLVTPLHESFVDAPVVMSLPLRPVFTVRQELLDHELFGGTLRRSGQIVVPDLRTPGSLRRFLEDTRTAQAAGFDIVVFPQGSVLGVEIAFEQGIGRLSRSLDLPILPVSISGTHRVWGYPFDTTVRFGQRVDVAVLPPIEARDASPERLRSAERHLKDTALESLAPVRRFNPDRDGWWDDYTFAIDHDYPHLAERMAAHRRQIIEPGQR